MDGRSTLVELRKGLQEAAEVMAEAASDLKDRLDDVKGGTGGLPLRQAEGIHEQVQWAQDLMVRICADVQKLVDGDLKSLGVLNLNGWEALADEGAHMRIF